MTRINRICYFFFLMLISWEDNSTTQKNAIYTNHPEIVFPVLDDIDSTATLYKIHGLRSYFNSNIESIYFVAPDHPVLVYGIGGEPIYTTDNEVIGRLMHYKISKRSQYLTQYRLRVILSTKLLASKQAVRHVMYHEIGHALGLEHNSESVKKQDPFYLMNNTLPFWYFEKGYELDEFRWLRYSDRYFYFVKQVDRKKWLKRYYLN